MLNVKTKSTPDMICGRCVCAMFAPMYCCLAPLPVGDKRREKTIHKMTNCFVPQHYVENKSTKEKRKIFIEKAKAALTKKEPENEKSKYDRTGENSGIAEREKIRFAVLRMGDK